MVIDQISRKYPDHSILSEEGSKLRNNADYTWVCDPIDGTIPFSHSVPTCMFSLALVTDGKPIVAATFDPFLDRMFTAIKGHGAFLNNKKIHVSNELFNQHSIIGNGLWHKSPYPIDHVINTINIKYNSICMNLESIVYMGMLVGLGEFVATIYSSIYAHDVAAIKLIVEEAGGLVTDIKGNDQRYDQNIQGAIISNGVVHDELIRLVHEDIKS